ncbi:MAG TPA: hypothetical protein VID93_05620 [Acidimicrobiales bacterium]|jgi:hypothetical protein
MPQVTREELTQAVKDALYAIVGVGVLTVQQLATYRQQMTERLSAQYGVGKDQVEQLITTVDAQLRTVDARVKVLETQIDGLLDSMQDRLPEQAGEVLVRARKAATEARKAATEAGEKLTNRVRDTAA